MITALTVLLGLVASFFGALVGFGGGFITVPVLRLVGHLTPQTVAGTSLFMVGVNVAVASFALRKKKRINVRVGRALGLGGIAGGLVGVFALRFVSGGQFDVLYGLMLIFIAFNMLRPARGEQLDETKLDRSRPARRGTPATSNLALPGRSSDSLSFALWARCGHGRGSAADVALQAAGIHRDADGLVRRADLRVAERVCTDRRATRKLGARHPALAWRGHRRTLRRALLE